MAGSGHRRRLANAIRANRYPRSGESISAASLVFGRAPEITDAFDRGVLIRSKHGLWLAIPTAEAGTRGLGRARITPLGWERRTGMRLRFVFRRGRPACSSPTTPASTPAASPRRSAAGAGRTGC